MIKENVKIMNWRNGFLLSLVSYILYLIIWLILDDETANQLPGMATVDYVVDFLLCMLFTYISLGFSYLVFKILPFRTSYVWVIVYASCLLTLNNLAGKFLSNLSKVYRYIITNLDWNLIPVRDEIKFLESYLYLMQVRHVGGVVTNISPELKECKGYLPPAVLQLLVENAIKHNGFSMENPLFIDITLSDDYITVRNLKSPLLSKMESTGLGHKNIIERYSLLCDKKVKIENAENFYSVSLPIIKKQSL